MHKKGINLKVQNGKCRKDKGVNLNVQKEKHRKDTVRHSWTLDLPPTEIKGEN